VSDLYTKYFGKVNCVECCKRVWFIKATAMHHETCFKPEEIHKITSVSLAEKWYAQIFLLKWPPF
jgi:hypothetical protein